MAKRCKKCGCKLEKGFCLNCGNEAFNEVPKVFLIVVGTIAVIVLLMVL